MSSSSLSSPGRRCTSSVWSMCSRSSRCAGGCSAWRSGEPATESPWLHHPSTMIIWSKHFNQAIESLWSSHRITLITSSNHFDYIIESLWSQHRITLIAASNHSDYAIGSRQAPLLRRDALDVIRRHLGDAPRAVRRPIPNIRLSWGIDDD